MAKQYLKNPNIDTITPYIDNLIAKVKEIDFGDPVQLSPEAFEALLSRLRHFRENAPAMSFWYVVDFRNNTFCAIEGVAEHFGQKISSRSDFFRLIHPDYLKPYFQWVSASYELSLRNKDLMKVMEGSFRVSLPMLNKDGDYYWYSQHTTITQKDAKGHVLTYLTTYYMEEKWSPLLLKPLGACLQMHNTTDTEKEQALNAIMAPYIIDEFTNSELEVINLYAGGVNTADVMKRIGWSRHTLNEYNASILKKARRLFQYNFRSAKEFSLYCLDRGFIYKR